MYLQLLTLCNFNVALCTVTMFIHVSLSGSFIFVCNFNSQRHACRVTLFCDLIVFVYSRGLILKREMLYVYVGSSEHCLVDQALLPP